MFRGRPYLNRFTKEKQQSIQDFYHNNNLEEIKPITTKQMKPNEIIVNRNKQYMIKQVKDIQIQRQNRLLLQKISSVMRKKSIYSASKTMQIRTNKSLNQTYKKQQFDLIESQNKKILIRLQSKKATLNNTKLHLTWQQNQKIIKKMSKLDYNLSDFKHSRVKNNSQSKKISKLDSTQFDNINAQKHCIINGYSIFIKIKINSQNLSILGYDQTKNIKIIQIPKNQAIQFIQSNCKGKIQNIFKKLKYDKIQDILYVIRQKSEITVEENPQQMKNKAKQLRKSQQKSIQGQYIKFKDANIPELKYKNTKNEIGIQQQKRNQIISNLSLNLQLQSKKQINQKEQNNQDINYFEQNTKSNQQQKQKVKQCQYIEDFNQFAEDINHNIK